jgi:hypothetical protein
MRIAQQTIATLVVLTFIISPAMAVLKTVASPSNSQFGFEGVSPGTDVFSLGGPQWVPVRMNGAVQTGDGAGGDAAGGSQSAMITQDGTSSNGRFNLNASPRLEPAHTGRFSFAFQMPTGNGDFELDVTLDSQSPDTYRAVWLSIDNGALRTRDAANGNAVSVVGNFNSGQWYEVLFEKPVWADGNVGQPFTVSLYDSTDGSLVGSVNETLGKDINGGNLSNWQFQFPNVSGNYLKLDHVNFLFDDAGNALPGFTPLGFRNIPEPATVSLLGFSGMALLRRRRA